MKKYCYLLAAYVFFALVPGSAYAMGILQGDTGYTPMPATNIGFTVTDNLGVRTTVEHGSIGGKDYIAGYRGLILNIVPLVNVASISFTGATNPPEPLLDKLNHTPLEAVIRLKDDTELVVLVDGSLRCYGKTPYGFTRIKLTLIDKIEGITLIKKHSAH